MSLQHPMLEYPCRSSLGIRLTGCVKIDSSQFEDFKCKLFNNEMKIIFQIQMLYNVV